MNKKITAIKAEIKLPAFIKKCVNYLIDLTKDIKSNDEENGDFAKIGSSGYYAKIGSSGYSAKIGSGGYYAKIGSSGGSAKIGSSGGSAQINAEGKNAVVACAGSVRKFKLGEEGCIAIPFNDGNRTRFKTVYVGEKGIKSDTWYELNEAGEFVEAKA